jgi:hypothetical protein
LGGAATARPTIGDHQVMNHAGLIPAKGARPGLVNRERVGVGNDVRSPKNLLQIGVLSDCASSSLAFVS